MQSGVSVVEVRLRAAVAWRVLYGWCHASAVPLPQLYDLYVHTETARAANETAKAKARDPHRLRTAGWRETVKESDREYLAFFGERAVRFGHESSFKDADDAQALINHEYLVIPDLMSFDQFKQMHEEESAPVSEAQAPGAALDGTSVPSNHDALALDLDDLGLPDFSDEELDDCF